MSRGPTYTNFVASGSVTMLCIQATRGGSTKFQQLVVESWRQLLSRPSLCQHAHPGPLECRHSTALAAAVVPPSAVGPAHIYHQQQPCSRSKWRLISMFLTRSHANIARHSVRCFVSSHRLQVLIRVLYMIGCVADAEFF